jgi:uncharacterized repeat protein (TIGR01451 family)
MIADRADVAILKAVSAPGTGLAQRVLVGPGNLITYTIAFLNNGPQTASGVAISDAIPVSVTQVLWSASGANVVLREGTAYAWDVDDLAPGEGGIITITGRLSDALPPGHVFTNTAAIASAGDTQLQDNTSAAWVVIAVSDYRVCLPLVLRDR